MNLKDVQVRPVLPAEEARYRELMQCHHDLGDLPKISETLWSIS